MRLGSLIERRPLRVDARLIAFSDGVQAVLPMVTWSAHKGWVKHHSLSVAGGYGGWLSGDAVGAAHAERLARYVGGLGSVQWLGNPIDPVAGASPPAGALQYTDAIALQGDMAAVLARWSKGHRAALNQARRAGVQVRLATSLADWHAYFTVYEDSLRRWGTRATSHQSLEVFEALCGLQSPNVRLWLATHEERVVAGAVCLYAPRHVSYWHGAALERAFDVRPVNLLLHEAIRDACERGLSWFDLGLSGGHEGVRAFKRSFGAVPLPCVSVAITTRWQRGVSALADLADRVRA